MGSVCNRRSKPLVPNVIGHPVSTLADDPWRWSCAAVKEAFLKCLIFGDIAFEIRIFL